MKSDNCCWNPATVTGFRQTDQNPAIAVGIRPFG
jgi:hypothetical protein